ncbi:hypothetical protein GF354_05850 [Candidatus Peregrinibacteria bacterium]|nr:hypothetical protein [Candidatus Peregrinibacteria bacterium]
MEGLNIISVGVSVAGFIVGGATTGVIGKMLLKNYLSRNDEYHENWRNAISDMKSCMGVINTKIDNITNSLVPLKDEVRQHDRDLIQIKTELIKRS